MKPNISVRSIVVWIAKRVSQRLFFGGREPRNTKRKLVAIQRIGFARVRAMEVNQTGESRLESNLKISTNEDT